MVSQQWIEKLKRSICDHLSLPYDEALHNAKIDEAKNRKFLNKDKFYRDLVFNEVGDDVAKNFKVEVEFCETPEQNDIWEYFRVHTSSIRTNKNIGRLIRMMVKHKPTQKYIGILSLSSDIYACAARDDYIGLNSSNRKSKINYILNITTCVGLQPVAYNYNVGKLLVALCFSDVVHNKIRERYGHDIACITTFSINGKSIQYDRLPYIKYVGETKGYAMTNIPDKLYTSCVRYLTHIKDTKTLGYKNRMYKVNKVLNYLDIIPEDAQKRGVYVGFTSPSSRKFMTNNDTDDFDVPYKTVDEICEWWIKRWACNRYEHLKREGRLRYKLEFHNAWKVINRERVKKSTEKKKELISETEYNKQKCEYMRTYRYEELQIQCTPDAPINMHWLGGFFDGDGCIENADNYVRVAIGQCDPKPLVLLYCRYGGVMRMSKNTGENSRSIFKWELTGSHCEPFIKDISDYVILENKRVQLGNVATLDAETKLQHLDMMKSNVKLYDQTLDQRINDAYIAGFFDAEGEVQLNLHSDGKNASYSMKITQKSNLGLLHAIARYLGYGNVDKVRLSVYSAINIKNMIQRILPYLIVKKTQAQTLLNYLDGKVTLQVGVETVKSEKHKVYSKDNVFKMQPKTVTKKVVKSKFAKQDDPKDLKDPKDPKDPNDNPNAKDPNDNTAEFSYTHRLNLKYSTAVAKHAKRKVNDKDIIDIRNKHKEGSTITSIAKSYELSRQYVSDIVHGKVLTMEELISGEKIVENLDKDIEQDAYNQTLSTLNNNARGLMKSVIARRKVKPITILKVMEMKYQNKDALLTSIFAKLKNEDDNLTMAMVKNYCHGKVSMFEPEFPIAHFTWSEYQKIAHALKE
jgi:hypothetical protein